MEKLANEQSVTDQYAMPRQRIQHNRETHALFPDFAQRLERFKEETDLSRSEVARRLETYRHTLWHWKEGKMSPHYQYRRALLKLSDSLGLGHLFMD